MAVDFQKDQASLFEWSFLILMWWFVCPLLTKKPFAPANVEKHSDSAQRRANITVIWLRSLSWVISGLIIYNLWQNGKNGVNIPWLRNRSACPRFGWGSGAFLSAAYVPQALLSPENSLRLSSTLFLKQISNALYILDIYCVYKLFYGTDETTFRAAVIDRAHKGK